MPASHALWDEEEDLIAARLAGLDEEREVCPYDRHPSKRDVLKLGRCAPGLAGCAAGGSMLAFALWIAVSKGRVDEAQGKPRQGACGACELDLSAGDQLS